VTLHHRRNQPHENGDFQMKAVVFTEGGEELWEVPEPVPDVGDVVLKMDFCGICGSDLHAAAGDFVPGIVMGHEFAGQIIEVGPGVSGWNVGERVCVNPNGNVCGTCGPCRSGASNLCLSVRDTSIGLARHGGLAPRVAVPAITLHRLPEEVSTRQGAWVEPLAVALRTVRRSEFRSGEDAIVFGAGPIGLLVTAILRSEGARSITVVAKSEARRSMASHQGADRILDSAELEGPDTDYFGDPAKAPSFAYDCTGADTVTRTALRLLAPQGRLTVTGYSRKPPSYDAKDLLFKELDIRSSFIYRDEFPAAIRMLATHKVDVDSMVTGTVPVEDARVAFDSLRASGSAIKYLIRGD
jgi:2-desacetyl-2-hydroxyethyl bacteriochlorophyllide A dehydrogenase